MNTKLYSVNNIFSCFIKHILRNLLIKAYKLLACGDAISVRTIYTIKILISTIQVFGHILKRFTGLRTEKLKFSCVHISSKIIFVLFDFKILNLLKIIKKFICRT